jgi:copper transport protein
MLAVFLLPRANDVELGAIVPVWSRWATYAVSALLLTGVAQALVEVGSPGALFSTRYGWTLVTKVSIVAVVLVVALASRRLVPLIVDRAEGAARRLRAVVVAEAALAALVLAAASLLVQTTPARNATAGTDAPAVVSAVLRDQLFTLTADVEPASVGLNDIHLYATTPDGQPADVKQWQVRVSLPAQGIEPIDAVILPITPDHAIGQVGLPVAGAWTFAYTLRTSDIDQSTVTTTVVIR